MSTSPRKAPSLPDRFTFTPNDLRLLLGFPTTGKTTLQSWMKCEGIRVVDTDDVIKERHADFFTKGLSLLPSDATAPEVDIEFWEPDLTVRDLRARISRDVGLFCGVELYHGSFVISNLWDSSFRIGLAESLLRLGGHVDTADQLADLRSYAAIGRVRDHLPMFTVAFLRPDPNDVATAFRARGSTAPPLDVLTSWCDSAISGYPNVARNVIHLDANEYLAQRLDLNSLRAITALGHPTF